MMKPMLYTTMLVMGLILTSSVVLSQGMRTAEQTASGDIYGEWKFSGTDMWLIFEKDKITMEAKDCMMTKDGKTQPLTVSSSAKITAESYAALSDVTKSGKNKAGDCGAGFAKDTFPGTALYEIEDNVLYLYESKDHKAGG